MQLLAHTAPMLRGIAVRDLSKSYQRGRIRALSHVTLDISAGEIFGLIGPNGAGKTTFLACLLGLLFPDLGSIAIGGQSPDRFAVRRSCGYLPERLSFDRWMTGRQFVAYHHGLAGEPRASRPTDVETVLERVELEHAAWDRPLKKYSRGMLQRLGFAQALIGRPRFLFLDEPSSGLDPIGVLAMRRLLATLRDEGVTVVINSHQLDQLERLCDRVAFLRGGRIEAVEDLKESSDRPRIVTARWMAWRGPVPAAEALPRIGAQTGTPLRQVMPAGARFSVSADQAAFDLLRALLEVGACVTELSCENGTLERYFFDVEGERA